MRSPISLGSLWKRNSDGRVFSVWGFKLPAKTCLSPKENNHKVSPDDIVVSKAELEHDFQHEPTVWDRLLG